MLRSLFSNKSNVVKLIIRSLESLDSVNPIKINDSVNPIKINDSVNPIKINDSVNPVKINDSVNPIKRNIFLRGSPFGMCSPVYLIFVLLLFSLLVLKTHFFRTSTRIQDNEDTCARRLTNLLLIIIILLLLLFLLLSLLLLLLLLFINYLTI